ncbi:replication-associated protein RepA [Streptococcus sanguinis SK72]|uniref:Replication-associated protein RepA n=1 Tax=Streptococcus sanguinis SK72 TaxID=888809 RepID=F0I3V3_STRSA|nr:replication initiator protein A [Streptococcus sanguinis]EGD28870.1 replication-associated protein RepA [Streptococcus sanguinis SK72]
MREIKLISASHYQTSERFYALPKILFENPIYENMRLDAKVAYAMLKDRLDLSFKNNWIDEEGNIYLVYSNSNLMKILNCSKSTLLRIKKQLNEYGLIREVQQSTSKSGNLANRIYLGLLQDDTSENVEKSINSQSDNEGVSDLDQGGVKKTPGGCQIDTSPVSNSASNDTNINDTDISETELIISEEDEEKEAKNLKNKNQESLFRKVDKATKYDKDYIYDLVYTQLLEDKYSDTVATFIMMPFEERYKYALENMRFARSSEMVAEYVYNGLLAAYNSTTRKRMD